MPRMTQLFVDVEIANVRDRRTHPIGKTRVSEDYMLTWISSADLDAAGIVPERTRELERPDGTIITRWTAAAILHVEGRSTIDDVLFCEPCDEALLGWRALGGLNLQVDEATGRLVDRGPIPAAAA